jgi:uncharacterized protein
LIVLDVNLLLYSHNPDAALHQQARHWLEEIMSGDETVGIPFMAATAFLRVATNESLTKVHTRMEDALAALHQIFECPNVRVLHTDSPHWRVLDKVLRESGVTGKHASDAQFAAFAIQHGATLCTTDRHFVRFPGLRWMNPLAERPVN